MVNNPPRHSSQPQHNNTSSGGSKNHHRGGKTNRGSFIQASNVVSSSSSSGNSTSNNVNINSGRQQSNASSSTFASHQSTSNSRGGGRGGGFRGGRGNYRGKRGDEKQAFKLHSPNQSPILHVGVISFGYWKDDPLISEKPTFYNCSKFMFEKVEGFVDFKNRKRHYYLRNQEGILKLNIKFDGKSFELRFDLTSVKHGIRLFVEGKNYYLELEPKCIPQMLQQQHLEIFKSTTRYRICKETDKVFKDIGLTQVFLLKLEGRQNVTEIIPKLFELLEGKIDSIPMKKIEFLKEKFVSPYLDKIRELELSTQYFLLVLESHGIFSPCNYTDNLFTLLKGDNSLEYRSKMETLLEKIYYDYLSKYPSRVFKPEETIQQYLTSKDFQHQMGRSILMQGDSAQEVNLCKKVIVTPTKIYFLPPEVDKTNRVIRYFAEHREKFFRVNFLDDNFNKLFAGEFRNISSRIKELMTKGISVTETKRLEFLGFSSSQLRNSSSWFFLRDSFSNLKPSPQDIRDYMGDFSDIETPAKVAARFGQCLSSTTPSIELTEEIVKVEDVERNGYIFTDGIGRISEEMMKSAKLQLPYLPSAIQFRCGGGKGVLALDPTLKGEKIIFRKSQFKFVSTQKQLEIVDYARRRSGFLNRQFITILSALGIKDDIFLSKQEEMIRSILSITDDISKAYEWLSIYHSNHTKTFICHILKYMPEIAASESFIRNMIQSYKEQLLYGLKEKTKIFIDKSAYLMGVVDEYGVLEENEIFINLSPIAHRPSAEYGVIKGECIVGKNPSLHKGDMRIVTAVDRPELHHLHDVIVFSQKGKRPITNMITGSDLDGDQFSVYWDPELIPKSDAEPMDYSVGVTKPKRNVDPEEDEKEKIIVKESDIIDFFIEFITRNNLGLIANLHLAHSDAIEGLTSDACLKLCELHSTAVDSAKSGKFAKIPSNVNLRLYPHFMIASVKKKYKSKRVLGKLFEETLKFKFEKLKKCLKENANPLLIVDGFDKYLKETEQHYSNYSRFVKSDMIKYGIEDEAQIISGWINTSIKCFGQKEQDVRESIAITISFYLSHFRKVFEEMVQKYGESERLAIASAWYYITYTEKNRSDIFSFAWINFSELVKIATRHKDIKVDLSDEEIENLEDESEGDFGEDYNEDDDLYDLTGDESDVESSCSEADSWTEGMDNSYFY